MRSMRCLVQDFRRPISLRGGAGASIRAAADQEEQEEGGQSGQQTLPVGWIRLRDEGTGREYFHDRVSQRSQWRYPSETPTALYMSGIHRRRAVGSQNKTAVCGASAQAVSELGSELLAAAGLLHSGFASGPQDSAPGVSPLEAPRATAAAFQEAHRKPAHDMRAAADAVTSATKIGRWVDESEYKVGGGEDRDDDGDTDDEEDDGRRRDRGQESENTESSEDEEDSRGANLRGRKRAWHAVTEQAECGGEVAWRGNAGCDRREAGGGRWRGAGGSGGGGGAAGALHGGAGPRLESRWHSSALCGVRSLPCARTPRCGAHSARTRARWAAAGPLSEAGGCAHGQDGRGAAHVRLRARRVAGDGADRRRQPAAGVRAGVCGRVSPTRTGPASAIPPPSSSSRPAPSATPPPAPPPAPLPITPTARRGGPQLLDADAARRGAQARARQSARLAVRGGRGADRRHLRARREPDGRVVAPAARGPRVVRVDRRHRAPLGHGHCARRPDRSALSAPAAGRLALPRARCGVGGRGRAGAAGGRTAGVVGRGGWRRGGGEVRPAQEVAGAEASEGEGGAPSAVAAAPDGWTVATRGGGAGAGATLWDLRALRARRPLARLAGPEWAASGLGSALAFAPPRAGRSLLAVACAAPLGPHGAAAPVHSPPPARPAAARRVAYRARGAGRGRSVAGRAGLVAV